MNNSQKIQALLDAEKEVSLKIARTRQNSYQYIKTAKEAAKKEIEALRLKKDAMFNEYEEMYTREAERTSAEYFKYVDSLIEMSKKSYEENKDRAIEKLVSIITEVEATPQQNQELFKRIQ